MYVTQICSTQFKTNANKLSCLRKTAKHSVTFENVNECHPTRFSGRGLQGLHVVELAVISWLQRTSKR